MKPKTRRYIYGIAIAALPLAVGSGIVSGEDAPLWAALIGSALVPGLAAANVNSTGGSDGAATGRHVRPDSVSPKRD